MEAIWKAKSLTCNSAQLDPQGHLGHEFIPVLCGSAFKNKGVQPLLNAVIDYLPSPLDVVDYMGFKPGDETKTVTSPVVRMTTCRSLACVQNHGTTPLLAR